jgi:hypothetical protein
MTSSIPDSFNLDELQAMLENAPSEDEPCSCDHDVIDTADEIFKLIFNDSEDPVVHKVVIMQMLHYMFDWHNTVGQKLVCDGDSKQASAWLKDAGKFQAILNILCTISVSDDDFTVSKQ